MHSRIHASSPRPAAMARGGDRARSCATTQTRNTSAFCPLGLGSLKASVLHCPRRRHQRAESQMPESGAPKAIYILFLVYRFLCAVLRFFFLRGSPFFRGENNSLSKTHTILNRVRKFGGKLLVPYRVPARRVKLEMLSSCAAECAWECGVCVFFLYKE